jgi:hypothetical protein
MSNRKRVLEGELAEVQAQQEKMLEEVRNGDVGLEPVRIDLVEFYRICLLEAHLQAVLGAMEEKKEVRYIN